MAPLRTPLAIGSLIGVLLALTGHGRQVTFARDAVLFSTALSMPAIASTRMIRAP